MVLAVGTVSVHFGQSPSWVASGLQDMEITGIASTCDVTGCVVIAGTNDGVYRSTDGGVDWTRVGAALITGRVHQLSSSDGQVILSANGGLYFSDDGAATWQLKYSSTDYPDVRACHIGPSRELFLVAYPGDPSISDGLLYVSYDEGTTWDRAVGGIIGSANILLMFTSGVDVYAVAGDGLISYEILYKWNPLERTWTDRYSFPPALSVRDVGSVDSGPWIAGTTDGALSSADRGSTWFGAGLFQNVCNAIHVDPDGTFWVGTAAHGVNRRAEGSTEWTLENNGLPPNPFQPSALTDPIQDIHRTGAGDLFVGTRDFGIYKASTSTVLPIEWTRGTSGTWDVAAYWQGANIPNGPFEQARHTLGSGPASIAVPQGYSSTINSFVVTPGNGSRGLFLRSGSQLSMGALSNLAPEAGMYSLTQRTGSRLNVTADVTSGFNVALDNGSICDVGGDVMGGIWRVGEAGVVNTTTMYVDGEVRSANLQLMHGSRAGDSGRPLAAIEDCVIRFGEESGSNGGGSIHVAGNMLGGSLLMAPALDFPSVPTRIVVGGEIRGTHVDMISNSNGGPCTAPPEQRPRITAGRYVDPVGEATLLKVDIDATNGTDFVGGSWFLDDLLVIGKIDSMVGTNVTFHHLGDRTGFGFPTGPGARIGHVGERSVNGPTPTGSTWLLEAGWVQLGPGLSKLEGLTINSEGPATCGYDGAELTADDGGFQLEVDALDLAFGAINRDPTAGAGLSTIEVNDLFRVDVSSMPGRHATLRIGDMVIGRDAHVEVPRIASSDISLDLRILGGWDNKSMVNTPTWIVQGAALTFEDDPYQITTGTPVPEVIIFEAHSLDRGAHWFCDVNGGAGVDLKPWSSFTVLSGAYVRIVDDRSVDSGEPNDDHGAQGTTLLNEGAYVDGDVKIEQGAVLDLNGLNLYCSGGIYVDGTVLNGTITPLEWIPFGAFDGDNDIDMDDRGILMAAYSGSGVPTTDLRCDGDGDRDVDDDDLAHFETNYTGQGVMATCSKRLQMHVLEEVQRAARLYPNPANENVKLSGNIGVTGLILIQDLSGRMVRTMRLNDGMLDISDLASGTYLLSWSEGGQLVTERLGIVR